MLSSVLLLFVAASSQLQAPAIPPEPLQVHGGQASVNCGWPSVVSLENSCTGTLIHPEIILFAAHCGTDYGSVWFGEQAYEGEGFSASIEYCRANPQFTQLGTGDDYAFCKLANPVQDVPVIPVVTGCEAELVQVGRDAAIVGFGYTENNIYGVKHEVIAPIRQVTQGEVRVGGDGLDSCQGDSGGPVFLRVSAAEGGNESWRLFGITSYGGTCGVGGWNTLAHRALDWIEQESGIDVTPCHYRGGVWAPTPGCRDFPTAPEAGATLSWADQCAGGPGSDWSSTCGAAFNDAPDSDGPVAFVKDPVDRSTLSSDPETKRALVAISADVTDAVSGVAQVELVINGSVVENSLDRDPPWGWNGVQLPRGVWEIGVEARDWAGNITASETIVVGVDEVPPELEPGTTGSSGDSGASSTAETSVAATTGGEGGSTSDMQPRMAGDASGCGCRSRDASGARLLWPALFVLGWTRSRRRRVRASRGCRPRGGSSLLAAKGARCR